VIHKSARYSGIEFGESALVPHTPAETVQRHYGDCKDQAAALVAALRKAGVEAYVALLKSGTRRDIEPELPGLGMFDHAIVYAPGQPDLWMDPTSPYARVNQLPTGDQGRLALVASAQARLVKTPELSSRDNRFREKRDSSRPPPPGVPSSRATAPATAPRTRKP
jgi:hypothetical protein